MNRTTKLIDMITDVIAYGFYPCKIKCNMSENSLKHKTLYDKIMNYYYQANTYENEFFKVNIENNRFNYEILKYIEAETILNDKFFGIKNSFEIQDGYVKTNGLINYRHLLMLKDFSNIPFDIKMISDPEFEIYKNKIKNHISTYSESELIKSVLDTFEKTKSFKYKHEISVNYAPYYKNYENYKITRFNKPNTHEIEAEIKKREWKTGDGSMSIPSEIFIQRSQNYSCLMDNTLYDKDINKLEKYGMVYRLQPYTHLFKAEGGIEFEYCNYTHWNKLIKFMREEYKDSINRQLFFDDHRFELVNNNLYNSNFKSKYYGFYIPISELIIMSKILDKEGASSQCRFEL